ncbi:unnamed protein product [Ilex paraguariensis]|uniref:Photosystem II 5 kDa protein, chloroplastic n=1 Tax=Ilex paraguariensis TaxID=185542 RepID=A0ABC8TB47_9AQUA
MASMTMTASFFGGSAAAATKQPPTAAGRGLVMAKATKVTEAEKNVTSYNSKEEEKNTGRRGLVFAAAAAAACSVAKVAMAGEPKKGTPEAVKKFAPVCVTMPTASICRK